MLLFSNFLVCCCSLFSIQSVYTQPCNYMDSFPVSYRVSESTDWRDVFINGCIDGSVLYLTDAKEISVECKSKQLTQIGRSFIRNLENLEKLWISFCKFETIEPGAFSNLPRLTEVHISKNSLKEVKKGVFDAIPSLNTLHLNFNEISYIDDNAFANLPNLHFFDINDNRCEYIRREWFTNTTQLVTFLMARNSVRQIPPGMFEGWSRLEWFNLNMNEISVIHDRAFKDVAPVIKNLDFHVNRLTTLSLNSFSDSIHIEILRISANLFNYLPEEFIRKAKVDYLYVHGNPFKCSCLERLHWVLHEKGGVILDYKDDPYFYRPCYSAAAPVCVVPAKFTPYCRDTVEAEVTQTYLTYLKKINYDQIQSFKCAMFDALTI